MNRLIYKALASARARAGLAIAGVAVSVLLVVVLLATFRNLTVAVSAYVGQAPIDLWVAPRGTDNLIRSSALLPEGVAAALQRIPGVRRTGSLLRSFANVELTRARSDRRAKREPISLLLIGYDAPHGLGGPPKLSSGRAPQGERELVLDRAAAYRLGAAVGSFVMLNGHEFKVVGLSAGTNLLATQFAFLNADAAARISGFGKRVSFVAVELVPGASAHDVARRIEQQLSGVSAYARTRFVENNVREVATGFRPILLLVSIVGVAAAAVLVALLIHGVVEDRKRDLAVLLAMGARGQTLVRAVMAHTLVLVSGGSVLGVASACGLREALDRWLPTVELAIAPDDITKVALLFSVVAMITGCVPLLRLRHIDPVEAFRS